MPLHRIFTPILAAALLAPTCLPASAASEEEVYYIQVKLATLGYDIGTPDGVAGRKTREAIADLAAKEGFAPTADDLLSHYYARFLRDGKPITDPEDMAKVNEALEDVLADPFSAKLKDVVMLPTGNVCGQVNAKNLNGAYVGFQSFLMLSLPEITATSGLFPFATQVDEVGSHRNEYLCILDVNFASKD